MKILFLIRSLYRGGQERQLVLLAKGLSERGHDVVVAVFYSGGPLERELAESKVRLCHIGKRGRWDVIGFLARVARVMKEERPEVVHGYLYDPNLVATILKPLSSRAKLVWGIRCANVDCKDWLMYVSLKLSRWLSRMPDAIISNSHAGLRYHAALGFPSENMLVIPNGVDTDRFYPDASARQRLRAEWGISDDEKLIGLVGRLDGMKDHPMFLRAAASLANARQDVRFVCVGGGPAGYSEGLRALATRLRVSPRILWTGPRDDMRAVYNALDLSVNCSHGEGLSNVIGEAMACGVPCVVTDVGDSAWVVGETGGIVPPCDHRALRNAIEQVLERPCRREEIRNRILERFSSGMLIANTDRVLAHLVGRTSEPRTVHSLLQ